VPNKRKSITKKLRFEVFKRDSFTCQYCGESAPDVILEVDHVNPVKRGGENEILNLVTACFDCNRGKGKHPLSENDTLKKQKEQLDELNIKREQLKLLMNWKKELNNIADEQIGYINDFLSGYGLGSLTEFGAKKYKRLIKNNGFKLVYDCFEISFDQYYVEDDRESLEKAIRFVEKIVRNKKLEQKDPIAAKRYYIRGILKNRLGYFNEKRLWAMLIKHLKSMDDYAIFEGYAKECRNWSEFVEMVEENYL